MASTGLEVFNRTIQGTSLRLKSLLERSSKGGSPA